MGTHTRNLPDLSGNSPGRMAALDAHPARPAHTARAQGRFAPTDCLSPLVHLAQAARPQTLSVSQVLLRCTHLLCNRLGIHAAAEAQITYLVARTLTDLKQER
jgi:hypothetical protein